MTEAIKNAAIRYQRIENTLKVSKQPMTISNLWETPSIRETCVGYHSIADALGFLRKKKQIRKVPNTNGGQARHAYEWITGTPSVPAPAIEFAKAKAIIKPISVPQLKQLPQNVSPDTNLRPEITVTQTGITVVTEKFKLTIEL